MRYPERARKAFDAATSATSHAAPSPAVAHSSGASRQRAERHGCLVTAPDLAAEVRS